MTNPNHSAYPKYPGPDGLTKREVFAIEIMAGLVSNSHPQMLDKTIDQMAQIAVASANALILALGE